MDGLVDTSNEYSNSMVEIYEADLFMYCKNGDMQCKSELSA